MAKDYMIGSPNGFSFEYIHAWDMVCIQYCEDYENMYMIIRALNHEELHSILQNFVNDDASRMFDFLIILSIIPREENNVYQLRDKTWETKEVK